MSGSSGASNSWTAGGTGLRRSLAGPVGRALLGRRAAASLGVTARGLALAPVVAWWVGTGLGYPVVERWVIGTWTGTDPRTVVLVWFGLLAAAATLSGALNDGLVPTAVLVAGPLFGLAVTRYGTGAGAGRVVSLPEAVGVAVAVAAVAGLPLALAGLLLGAGLRRAVAAARADLGPAIGNG
jgi:hypothetical protein